MSSVQAPPRPVSPPGAVLSIYRRAHMSRLTGIVVPFVVLIVVMAITTPVFASRLNVTNILLQASVVGLLALGQCVVLLTGEIDLSLGAVEGLTAVIAAIVAVQQQAPWPVAVAAAILAGVGVGLVNGVLVTVLGVPSFIATLGTLGIATGVALRVTDGQSIHGFAEAYQFLGQGRIAGIPIAVGIVAGLFVLVGLVMRYSRFGLNVYAVGGNRQAAEYVGISAVRVRTLALVLSGACAGVAGVLASASLNAANGTLGGNIDLLDAVAAVVIGGTALTGGVGTVLGTAIGILFITTIRNSLDLLGVSPFWQQAAVGSLILFAAIADSVLEKRRAAR